MRIQTIAVLAVAWIAACSTDVANVLEIAAGADFRVENKVYVGTEKEPHAESTTIFHEGIVYDFLQQPQETIVFDKPRERFILLDLGKRVRTEVKTADVSSLNEHLKRWAASQSDPLLQFLADPQLDEQMEKEAGDLVLSSEWLTYRVVPADTAGREIAVQYREFSDWSAMLNTQMNPGSKPPFARLILNETLARRGQVPKEVHLTMQSKKSLFAQKTVARSEHVFIRHLVQSDRDRIKQIDEFMTIFSPVQFAEYHKAGK